jgi:hypothetical protein
MENFMAQIHVLAAVALPSTVRFRENLSKEPQFQLTIVSDTKDAGEILNDITRRTDAFIIDNALGGVFEFVKELRQTHPRLLILLVDEEADFGMPGHADEVSVTPFENDDLLKRIKRLTEERSLETLRADALPPVRNFAKSLRRAGPGQAKQQAAVEAIKELGYDYVAFYNIMPTTPPELSLGAQIGPSSVTALAPTKQPYEGSIVGKVSQDGLSRIIGPEDEFNHPFVKQQRFGAGVCVPVGTTLRFGVIFACRTQPNAITQPNVLMLELVSAQLASALAKQARS